VETVTSIDLVKSTISDLDFDLVTSVNKFAYLLLMIIILQIASMVRDELRFNTRMALASREVQLVKLLQ
jgi:hypothetical protein